MQLSSTCSPLWLIQIYLEELEGMVFIHIHIHHPKQVLHLFEVHATIVVFISF